MTKRLNPVALRLTHRLPPYVTLHHVGRRSGRRYDTPVVGFAVREPRTIGEPVTVASARDILVLHPLPWGADVDWCRNIRAAGQYTLTRRGHEYRVEDPHLMDGYLARTALRTVPRVASRLLGIDQFLAGRLRPPAGPDAM